MKVSIWVGCALSWHVLDECLTFAFTEDGDAIPCPFGDAFGIDWFDEDLRAASVSDAPSVSVKELLVRHSNGSAIADAVAMAQADSISEPCNAVVVLYDFEYTGQVHVARFREVTLRFIGCFEITA